MSANAKPNANLLAELKPNVEPDVKHATCYEHAKPDAKPDANLLANAKPNAEPDAKPNANMPYAMNMQNQILVSKCQTKCKLVG